MAEKDLYPAEILAETLQKGIIKTQLSFQQLAILSFLGGAFIALGYLSYLKVVAGIPHDWSGLATLLGASVFPIGLVLVVICGGELLTGNLMAVAVAYFAKKVSLKALLNNWLMVFIGNLMGALFVAYFFADYLHITPKISEKTIAVALSKTEASIGQMIISGIGCNWLVCLGVWLGYGAKQYSGKILGIWFPVMIFVLIGFQHVVANMFVIPCAMFLGANISFWDFSLNMIFVWLGNIIGGAVFVGGVYYLVYGQKG